MIEINDKRKTKKVTFGEIKEQETFYFKNGLGEERLYIKVPEFNVITDIRGCVIESVGGYGVFTTENTISFNVCNAIEFSCGVHTFICDCEIVSPVNVEIITTN